MCIKYVYFIIHNLQVNISCKRVILHWILATYWKPLEIINKDSVISYVPFGTLMLHWVYNSSLLSLSLSLSLSHVFELEISFEAPKHLDPGQNINWLLAESSRLSVPESEVYDFCPPPPTLLNYRCSVVYRLAMRYVLRLVMNHAHSRLYDIATFESVNVTFGSRNITTLMVYSTVQKLTSESNFARPDRSEIATFFERKSPQTENEYIVRLSCTCIPILLPNILV